MIYFCSTQSQLHGNTFCFLDILLESDFIKQFVVLVPKIIIWCDMTIIVHKMKMESTFLKLLTLTKSFIITTLSDPLWYNTVWRDSEIQYVTPL